MISQVSGFKLLDRGFEKTLCLVPGWATDYRIFSLLELDYNYLLPVEFSPLDFKDKLKQILDKESLNEISLLGWSQGGYLAADFTLGHPERIAELILVSMRKAYPQRTLEEARVQLKKNRRAYLYKFYLECFSDADRQSLSWFRKNLLRDYLSEMELGDLMNGLDYLSGAGLDLKSLASIKKIRFFHGLEDKIAPVQEIRQMQACLPVRQAGLLQADFIYIEGTGHLPFLSKIFREKFYHG